MNLQEISQLVSTLVADSSNNFFTESERLQAINGACSYINSELKILVQTVPITMTITNGGRIPLPVDFVALTGPVQWKDASNNLTTLQFSVPQQITNTSWDSEVGTPSKYVMEGGAIHITPAPQDYGTVILSYLAMPNKLLNPADIPFYGDVRVQAYHDMIAYYAAWQLSLKDRDFEAAKEFMGYFQSRFVDLKENLRRVGTQIQPVWSDTYSVV